MCQKKLEFCQILVVYLVVLLCGSVISDIYKFLREENLSGINSIKGEEN